MVLERVDDQPQGGKSAAHGGRLRRPHDVPARHRLDLLNDRDRAMEQIDPGPPEHRSASPARSPVYAATRTRGRERGPFAVARAPTWERNRIKSVSGGGGSMPDSGFRPSSSSATVASRTRLSVRYACATEPFARGLPWRPTFDPRVIDAECRGRRALHGQDGTVRPHRSSPRATGPCVELTATHTTVEPGRLA